MGRGGGRVRIGVGRLRGRSLAVSPGVRPSGARLRESLFDIWGDRVAGARVLDLFAGSGAVGLEALSRGAGEVWLVEGERATLRRLTETCRRWDLDQVRVVRRDLPTGLSGLAAEGGTFDLTFADPPYAFGAYDELLRAVAPLLRPAGELAVEHSARVELPSPPPALQLADRRRYGEHRLTFFRPTGSE